MGNISTLNITTNKDVPEIVNEFKKLFEGKVYPEQVGPANEVVIKPIDLTLGFLVPSLQMFVKFEKNGQGILCSATWRLQGVFTFIVLLIAMLLLFPIGLFLVIPQLLASSRMSKYLTQLLAEFKTHIENTASSSAASGKYDKVDKYEQLEKLGLLKDKGHISEEEFQAEKKKIMEG